MLPLLIAYSLCCSRMTSTLAYNQLVDLKTFVTPPRKHRCHHYSLSYQAYLDSYRGYSIAQKYYLIIKKMLKGSWLFFLISPYQSWLKRIIKIMNFQHYHCRRQCYCLFLSQNHLSYHLCRKLVKLF